MTSQPAPPSPHRQFFEAHWQAFFWLAVLVGWEIALRLSPFWHNHTVWHLPGGLAMALMLRYGPGWGLPWLLLRYILGSLLPGADQEIEVLQHIVVYDLPVVLVALFFSYVEVIDLQLDEVRDVSQLVALPTGLGLTASAIVFLLHSALPGRGFDQTSLDLLWWSAALGGGLLAIFPLALRHAFPLLERPRAFLLSGVKVLEKQGRWHWLAMILAALVINWIVFQPGQTDLAFGYLSLLIVLWATMQYSLNAATLGLGLNMLMISLFITRTAAGLDELRSFALLITVLNGILLLMTAVGLARQRAEGRARQQEILLDQIPDAMITIDTERRIVGWNRAAERTFGWREAEVLGHNISEVMKTEGIDSAIKVIEAYQRVAEVGSARFHVSQQRKDGRRIEVDLLLFSRHDPDGKLIGYVGINQDLSEQQALQRRYATLLSALPDLILRLSAEGICQEINSPSDFELGVRAREIIGQPLHEIFPQALDMGYLDAIHRILETGDPELHQFADPSGRTRRYFEARLVRDGESVVVVLRDVTERRLQEEALRTSEQVLRRVAEEAQRAAQELLMLDRIHSNLAAEQEPQALLDRAVGTISEETPYSLVNIWAVEGDTMRLRAQPGYPDDLMDTVPVSEGVMGRCVRSGQPQLVPDVSRDPDYIPSMEGILSEACTPIRVDGEVAFILNVENKGERLGESDLHFIERVAAEVESELKRAHLIAALDSSERRFRALIEKSAEVLLLIDADLRVQYISPAAERAFGWTPQDVVDHSLRDFLHPEDQINAPATTSRLIEQPGQSFPIAGRVRNRAGEWRHVEGYATNLLNDPTLRAIALNVLDVTERRKVEEELRFSEDSARKLFEAATRQALELMLVDKAQEALAGELDLPGLFRRVIQELADLMRFDYASIYLREGDHLVLQEHHGPVETRHLLPLDQGLIARAYRLGRMVYAPHAEQEPDYLSPSYGSILSEVAVPLRDGEQVVGVMNIETVARPIPPDDCRIIESVARHLSTGITRARLVRAIQSSEARFRAMLEENVDVVLLVDRDWRLAYASPNVKRLMGYDYEEFTRMRLADMTDPADYRRILRTFIEARRSPGRTLGPVVVQGRHRDGRFFWAEGMVTNLLDEPAVGALVLNVRDISQREEARQSERKQRLLAEALAQTSAALTSTLNPDEVLNRVLETLGHVMSFDSAAVLLLEGEELSVARYYVPGQGEDIGSHLLDQKYPLQAFGNCQRALQLRQPVIVGDTRQSDIWTLVSGSEWILSNAVANITIEGEVVGFLNISSATPGFFKNEDGLTLTTFADQAALALRNARLYAAARESVETLEARVRARTAELEQVNQQLTLLDKVKDEFLANVSHELRTPIASLRLYHDLVSLKPSRLPEYIERLRRETMRLELLVEDLIDLSRMDQGQVRVNRSRLDLGRLAEQLVRDRSSMALGQRLDLRYAGADFPAMVLADSRLIERALSALMTNALTYTPAGGRVELRLVEQNGHAQDWVGVAVLDNGPGIPPEERGRLFERFFRGKIGLDARAAGTGLGLSIVKEIADLHGARIEVEEAGLDGRGAGFTLWLPRVNGD